MNAGDLNDAARAIQLAITPVFLLAAIATLISVFSTRLARVGDIAELLAKQPKQSSRDAQLRLLRWRAWFLDFAVLLAALAGALSCGAVFALFLGEVRQAGAENSLFLLFGGAIFLTTGSLGAFVTELLMAGYGIRRFVANSVGDGNGRR